MPSATMKYTQVELDDLQYPVLVESYDKIRDSGSKRRKYLIEFNKYERDIINRYYTKFYQWYLIKGTPESATMQPSTYVFLQRAINFFANI